MDRSVARQKYNSQKHQAASRGIGWDLTFEQWLDWWGEDLDRRGVGTNRLQMQRIADTGPYALGNIRKGLPVENAKTCGRMKRLRNTLAAKAVLEAARDQCEPGDSKDWLDDDEYELNKMFGVRSSAVFSGHFAIDKQKRKA